MAVVAIFVLLLFYHVCQLFTVFTSYIFAWSRLLRYIFDTRKKTTLPNINFLPTICVCERFHASLQNSNICFQQIYRLKIDITGFHTIRRMQWIYQNNTLSKIVCACVCVCVCVYGVYGIEKHQECENEFIERIFGWCLDALTDKIYQSQNHPNFSCVLSPTTPSHSSTPHLFSLSYVFVR